MGTQCKREEPLIQREAVERAANESNCNFKKPRRPVGKERPEDGRQSKQKASCLVSLVADIPSLLTQEVTL